MRPRHAAAIAVAVLASAAAALFAASAAVARAQQPPITRPAVTLIPDSATVGDRLTLTITVDHADGIDIIDAPTFGADFGGLDLIDVAQPVTAQLSPGLRRTTLVYTLAAFRTGAFTVPAMTLAWTDGRTTGATGSTEPRTVTINSVLAPGDTSLRPLKPQLDVPQAAPSPAVPALVVAFFAVFTVAGYIMYFRIVAIPPPTPAVAAPVAPPAPPHVRARASLDALAGADFAERDAAEYYARIAGTVRRYLSERFAVAAYAMTRTEIAAGMTAAGIDRWPARLAANLLEQCESVEFAGFRPAPDRRAADLAAAYEIIELTAEPDAQPIALPTSSQ